MVAQLHTQTTCVTRYIDAIEFRVPAKVGDLLIVSASINRVWGSSFEVGVRVIAHNVKKGTDCHITSTYLTFVSIDNDGNTVNAPRIDPALPSQWRRYEEAEQRRMLRLTKK